MRFTVPSATEGLRRLLRRRFSVVRQYDRTDCGPASLLTVLRYFGGNASLVTVRELSGTGVSGTSLWSLSEAAKALGFEPTGASGTYADLQNIRLPCIAHFLQDNGLPHFVVVFRVTASKALLGDPARGLGWVKKSVFCERWKTKAVLLLSPTDRLLEIPTPHWSKWIFKYFRREEAWLTQALFTGFAYAGLGLLTALFVRALIDGFIPSGNVRSIVYIGGGLLGLLVFRGLVGYLRSWVLIELSRRVNTNLTVDTLSHLFDLPTSFFESRRIGDITARVNDSVRIHAVLLNVLGGTAIDVVVVLGSLCILTILAPQFAWLTCALLPVLTVAVAFTARLVRGSQFEVKQAYAGVQASYIDSINAIDAIRGTNSTSTFGSFLSGLYEQFQHGLARLGLLQTRVSVAVELVTGGVVVVALTYGSLLVVQDSLTLGTMMAAYSLLAGMIPAVARIIEAFLQFQEAGVASTRLLDLVLVDKERTDGNAPFRMIRGLALRNAAFSWRAGEPLFDHINIDVPRGRLTALCGPSGVGKSTLVKILDRRYPPTRGTLLIDTTPAQGIDLQSYRRKVTTLPESVSIINGTIAENILLGRTADDVQEVVDRIECLGLTRFMNRFPHGVFTLIGKDGRQISSGERQTIGLLRAIWDEPDVLLVDEGMNAVDIEIAEVFYKTITDYAETHAVLVVSHRPRTLLRADYVYVLDANGVAEHGTPKSLIEAGREFASMISTDIGVNRPA